MSNSPGTSAGLRSTFTRLPTTFMYCDWVPSIECWLWQAPKPSAASKAAALGTKLLRIISVSPRRPAIRLDASRYSEVRGLAAFGLFQSHVDQLSHHVLPVAACVRRQDEEKVLLAGLLCFCAIRGEVSQQHANLPAAQPGATAVPIQRSSISSTTSNEVNEVSVRLQAARRICHSSGSDCDVRPGERHVAAKNRPCHHCPAGGVGTSLAQQAGGFVGEWQGTVDGLGETKIVITSVSPDGRVEGRMEFALHSFVATFDDKPHPIGKTSLGVVSGGTLTLTIEAALGGTYRLTLSGDSLAGSYTRGTTFSGKATFRRQ